MGVGSVDPTYNYLKYQNKRPDYVDAWMKIINWEGASKRFEIAQACKCGTV